MVMNHYTKMHAKDVLLEDVHLLVTSSSTHTWMLAQVLLLYVADGGGWLPSPDS